MRIVFHHAHAYPGCRATVADAADSAAVEAEFSDGARPVARVVRAGTDEMTVEIAAYGTARGAAIPAKRWILRRVAGDGWKVVRRAQAQR